MSAPGHEPLMLTVRFLTDPGLWAWCWELRSADGRAFESSWESRWTLYETAGEAVGAGLGRLVELTRSPRSHPEAPVQIRVRHLVIVARAAVDLHASLTALFRGEPLVEIVRDRRFDERRRRREPCPVERRLGDRRSRPELDAQIASGGWAVVTLPKPSHCRSRDSLSLTSPA